LSTATISAATVPAMLDMMRPMNAEAGTPWRVPPRASMSSAGQQQITGDRDHR